jgi:hypothetical protein
MNGLAKSGASFPSLVPMRRMSPVTLRFASNTAQGNDAERKLES